MLGGWQGQVHAALVGLGWGQRDADAAVSAVTQRTATAPPTWTSVSC